MICRLPKLGADTLFGHEGTSETPLTHPCKAHPCMSLDVLLQTRRPTLDPSYVYSLIEVQSIY